MKVAEYRTEIGHCHRTRMDYFACVGQEEKERWLATAKHLIVRFRMMECKTAKTDDLIDMTRAVELLQGQIDSVRGDSYGSR